MTYVKKLGVLIKCIARKKEKFIGKSDITPRILENN